MEIEGNILKKCNFIRNLCERVSEIHNEAVKHENSFPECEICSQNTNEFSFIKNQLFLIVKINLQLKDETPREEENVNKSEFVSIFDSGNFQVSKEETKDPQEDLLEFSDDDKDNFEEFTDSTPIRDIQKERLFKTSPRTTNNTQNVTLTISDHVRSKTKAERKHVTDPESFDCSSISIKYQCEYCEKKFKKKCNLVMHMKSHCKDDNTLKTKAPSRKNSSSTDDKEKQKCPFCNRIFKRKHECRLVEPKAPTIFSCAYCPETFSTYPKIYVHHKAHHSDKPKPLSPFQCDICGAFALRLYALKRHMLVHTDYAPFECDLCKKKFRTRQKLTEHQRKHIPKAERDDKYKCEICQKKFTFRQSLKKHKNHQHTNNRTLFPCTICGGKFISSTSLQKHQTTHDGEAPRAHKCDQCGRIFEKLKYFNHHRKIRHNIYTDLMLNPKPKKKK